MVGLDGAGKTTLLYQLKLGQQVETIPTVGFTVETVRHRNIELNVWDVGGQRKLESLWQHYLNMCHVTEKASSPQPSEHTVRAIVFVVDAADHGRIDEAREELRRVASYADTHSTECERLAGPLLVVANKSDLENAMPVPELERALGLREWNLTRTYRVLSASAATGDGVKRSFDWLVESILRPEN